MGEDEIEFMSTELKRAWFQRKDPQDRLDVLFITSAQRASRVGVTEIFSIPRLCKLAEEVGMSCGGSYDILTGWDLRSAKKKAKLRAHLEKIRPRHTDLSTMWCSEHASGFQQAS